MPYCRDLKDETHSHNAPRQAKRASASAAAKSLRSTLPRVDRFTDFRFIMYCCMLQKLCREAACKWRSKRRIKKWRPSTRIKNRSLGHFRNNLSDCANRTWAFEHEKANAIFFITRKKAYHHEKKIVSSREESRTHTRRNQIMTKESSAL